MAVNILEQIDAHRQAFLTAAKRCKEKGVAYAEAEAAYQAAKWMVMLSLKAQGVPATLIQVGIKGHPEVNPLYLKRMTTEVDYKSETDAVNAFKLSARLLEEQAKREWNEAGGML